MEICERSNDRPVSLNDRFRFHCIGCAECCRHVAGVVPLCPLDLFKLAAYLRNYGIGVTCTDDVLAHFASPAMINDSGFFVYFLRAVEDDDRCIFLNGNRCSIQDVKPVACRMYPLEAAPAADGSFQIILSTEKAHHFKGRPFKVKSWFYRNMPEDIREFYRYDFCISPQIHKLLLAVPNDLTETALLQFHRYRYSDFDLNSPFMPQFKANTEKLICELQKLARN